MHVDGFDLLEWGDTGMKRCNNLKIHISFIMMIIFVLMANPGVWSLFIDIKPLYYLLSMMGIFVVTTILFLKLKEDGQDMKRLRVSGLALLCVPIILSFFVLMNSGG